MALSPREPTDANPRKQGGPPTLRDRYVIDPAEELAALSQPSLRAFAVQDRRDATRPLFALIGKPGLPPRVNSLTHLRGESIRGLLPLVEFGVVDWPDYSQRCFAAVYQKPTGGRLTEAVAAGRISINEHDLPRRIIEPIAAGLRELAPNDISHRAIRPENLFVLDEDRQSVVVGDGAMTPPGYDQPAVFEPVERAMATPEGRGRGSIGDDLYALGVTIVFLLVGRDPVAKLSEDQLLNAKIEQGSYATLCGRERIPMSLLEPLRGMLSDDPDERWTLDELERWINGRRLTPIQRKPAQKIDARFSFAGREHATVRTLAHAFTKHVPEAARAIRKGQLDAWVRRSLKDAPMADAVAAAADLARVFERDHRGSDDYLVAKTVAILDPRGPIRYKGLSFLPEAFGTVMAVEAAEKGSMPRCAEVLANDIAGLWFVAQPNYTPGHSNTEKLFAQLRGHAANRDPGYGMERCLYEFNPALPCQSSFIVQDHVVDMRQLLPALDQASSRVDTTQPPVDRHIAAFVGHRLGTDIEPHLRALCGPSPSTQINGMLSLLAFVQWKHGPDQVLGLASWIGGLLGPTINSYHGRTLRHDLERAIPRVVRQGSLPELYNLIENQEKREEDRQGFLHAVEDFAATEREIQDVEHSDGSDSQLALTKGEEAAAMSSILLTMLVMSMVVLFEFF